MDKDREYAKKLVGYVEIHKDTPRALILINHLAQLAYIAGCGIKSIPSEQLKEGHFVSLYDYETDSFVNLARQRIKNELIAENWDEALEAIFQEKGVSLQRLSF